MQPMFLCVFIACNAQTWSCSSSLIRTEVTIHHSACAPVLSGRTRVIHHSHGNCLFSGQLCNQRPIRPSARLSLLLSLSANCHSLIRLSQTIRHQRQEEKKEVVFLFFFYSFLFHTLFPLPTTRLFWSPFVLLSLKGGKSERVQYARAGLDL